MKNKIFFGALFVLIIFLVMAFPVDAQYRIQIPSGAETGLPDPPRGIVGVLENVLNWILAIIGMLAVIGFAVSGIQYMTAAGNEDAMEAGKRNMKYSIIGVVVALSGFIVVQAVDLMLRGWGSSF